MSSENDIKPVEILSGIESGEEWTPKDDKTDSKPLEVSKDDVSSLWTESAVRQLLGGLTGGANALAGESVGADLKMTPSEVDQIAPPLTNILNRSPRFRSMAKNEDTLAIALGMLTYSIRVGGEVAESRAGRPVEQVDKQVDTQVDTQVDEKVEDYTFSPANIEETKSPIIKG